MTDTNNTNGSNTETQVSDKMTVKELVAHYNAKAKALGLATVKDFKTKALALARITGLTAAAPADAPAAAPAPAAAEGTTLPVAGTTTEAPAETAETATASTEAPASTTTVATPVTAAPAPAAPAKIKINFSGEIRKSVEVDPNTSLDHALAKANGDKPITGMTVRDSSNKAVPRSKLLTADGNYTVSYQRSGG